MNPTDPIPSAIKKEFTDWRLWWTRSLVIALAALAGLTVVGLSWLSELALRLFFKTQGNHWWFALVWTPLCTAAIVWLTRRFAPGASGSGIPQVIASLEPGVNSHNRRLFVSTKLTIAKFFLTAWGLLAGLSLGREGPSVQIAAGIMVSGRRWLPKRSGVSEHGLLVAGGAAGIAAAFNAPLAGIMFAIEELSRTPEQRSSGLLISGIVLAGLIGQSIYGNDNYFGVINAASPELSLIFPGLLVTLLSGLAGGLFARLIVYALDARSSDKISLFRRARPVLFAAACGLAIAIIGVITHGATFGSGYIYTRDMIEGSQSVPIAYVLFKFIATCLTTWAGVPAGLFAPSLSIGAAIGNDIALFTQAHAPTLIALGMAGFLAAVTQAPLTAFIIVMEMVGGHSMVLSLMACALVASMISRFISPPLYSTLAGMQLLRLTPVQETAPPTQENAPSKEETPDQKDALAEPGEEQSNPANASAATDANNVADTDAQPEQIQDESQVPIGDSNADSKN